MNGLRCRYVALEVMVMIGEILSHSVWSWLMILDGLSSTTFPAYMLKLYGEWMVLETFPIHDMTA